jgi:hypothetical protein
MSEIIKFLEKTKESKPESDVKYIDGLFNYNNPESIVSIIAQIQKYFLYPKQDLLSKSANSVQNVLNPNKKFLESLAQIKIIFTKKDTDYHKYILKIQMPVTGANIKFDEIYKKYNLNFFPNQNYAEFSIDFDTSISDQPTSNSYIFELQRFKNGLTIISKEILDGKMK